MELKVCMYAKWDLPNILQQQKPNQTKPIQTKPNQTSFTLNNKFSAISHLIQLKFCMYTK